jgi:branched-subunit amino acid permease
MSAHDHRRPLWHVALVALLIVGVGLHAIGVIVVSKVGPGIVSVNSPILYILIGIVLVGVLFKLTHVASILRKRKNGSARDTL